MLLDVGINRQVNVVRMASKKIRWTGGSMEILFTFFCYSVEEEKREPCLLLQTQYCMYHLFERKIKSEFQMLFSCLCSLISGSSLY